MSGDVHELMDNQARAADPQHSVWLSASAGTGKTQVLSARVLRLLLGGNTDPSQILCLTFTKAARSEEHTSELRSLMRISYAVFCLKTKQTAHLTYYTASP